MEERKLRVEISGAGKRIDKFLVDAFEGKFSRSFIKKLIKCVKEIPS